MKIDPTKPYEIKIKVVTKEYKACEKEIEKFRLAIQKLIRSTEIILRDVIPAGTINHMQEVYREPLTHTIVVALDKADKLIEKHCITKVEDVLDLRAMILDLPDDVEELFNQ